MHESDMMYIGVGFILAIAGFGIYALQVFNAYLKEKKKIEEDFELSKKYEPKAAYGPTMVFMALGFTGVVFVLLSSMLLMFSENYDALPNSANLVARFIMIMGATVLVAEISKIPVATASVRELVHSPILPDYIKQEKDLQRRSDMADEYYENNGFEHPRRNFGKYFVLLAPTDTLLIYVLLVTILLLTFTNLLGGMRSEVEDVSTDFAYAMFATGVLYVVLTIPAIFSVKKSAEIEMTQENFGKKVMVEIYGFIPSIIGVVIMIFTMMPLLGE